MHEVHRFSTKKSTDGLTGLAQDPVTPDNGALMSEQKTSPKSTLSTDDAIAPVLRLAGTPAGEPSIAEKRVLELRNRAVLVLGSLKQESRMLQERLERAGRYDPVKRVTGSSALDVAAEGTQSMIEDLDELLLEVGETVSAGSD